MTVFSVIAGTCWSVRIVRLDSTWTGFGPLILDSDYSITKCNYSMSLEKLDHMPKCQWLMTGH